MGVPRNRLSNARKKSKRAHSALRPSTHLKSCSNCNSATTSHTICRYCGFYAGKQFLKIKKPSKHISHLGKHTVKISKPSEPAEA